MTVRIKDLRPDGQALGIDEKKLRQSLLSAFSVEPFRDIADQHQSDLIEYACRGVEPRNEWLRAILRNDLIAVTLTEDRAQRTWPAAKLILAALYDFVPDDLWGSHAAYERHITTTSQQAQLAARRWKSTVETAENAKTMGQIIRKGWSK